MEDGKKWFTFSVLIRDNNRRIRFIPPNKAFRYGKEHLTHIAESAKVTFLKIYKFGVFRGVFAPFHSPKKLKKLKIRLRPEKVCDVVHPPVCRIEELALPL